MCKVMQSSKIVLDITERSYNEFKQACKSNATLKSYTECVNRFMKHCGYTSYNTLAKTKPNKIRTDFSNFFSFMRDRHDLGEIRSTYFRPHISGLELFLIQNDVEVDLRKFKKRIPDKEQTTGDKPYTTEEIQDMVKQADLRGTALVLILSSTGMRGGAIWDLGNYLKFKHLIRFDDGCGRLHIYHGTTKQYPAFLTPEALEALDKYKRYRIRNGETVTGDSPLFRATFEKGKAGQNAIPLKKPSIDAILRRLAEKTGVRKRSNSAYTRHDKRTEYSFRIRWNTIMKNHDPPLHNNKIERMFSHNSKTLPLDSVYNKPEDQVLHEEFDKAVLDLTIDPTQKQKIELEKNQQKINKLVINQKRIDKLEDALNTLMYIASGKGWGYSDEEINDLWEKFTPKFRAIVADQKKSK